MAFCDVMIVFQEETMLKYTNTLKDALTCIVAFCDVMIVFQEQTMLKYTNTLNIFSLNMPG